MRAMVLAASLLALVLPAGVKAAGFRLPSGNIACGLVVNTLRCDILSGLRPEPRSTCELDWTGLTLSAGGRARPTCAGDTVVDPSAPVLAYGGSWRRAGITCLATRSALVCTNGRGHGFLLAREGWRLL